MVSGFHGPHYYWRSPATIQSVPSVVFIPAITLANWGWCLVERRESILYQKWDVDWDNMSSLVADLGGCQQTLQIKQLIGRQRLQRRPQWRVRGVWSVEGHKCKQSDQARSEKWRFNYICWIILGWKLWKVGKCERFNVCRLRKKSMSTIWGKSVDTLGLSPTSRETFSSDKNTGEILHLVWVLLTVWSQERRLGDWKNKSFTRLNEMGIFYHQISKDNLQNL